jgi:hypothetical protein
MKQWGRVRARESCRSGKGEASGGEGWRGVAGDGNGGEEREGAADRRAPGGTVGAGWGLGAEQEHDGA